MDKESQIGKVFKHKRLGLVSLVSNMPDINVAYDSTFIVRTTNYKDYRVFKTSCIDSSEEERQLYWNKIKEHDKWIKKKQ